MRQIETPRGPITIRPTVEADMEKVRALRVEAITLHPEVFTSTPDEVHHHKFHCDDDHSFFIALHGSDIVGLTGIYRGKFMKERHRAGIWSVYVRESFRSCGVAVALLEAAIHWAGGRGIEIVELMVATTNTAAIACYHRLGFRISGTEHATIKVGDTYYDEFNMYRWIKK